MNYRAILQNSGIDATSQLRRLIYCDSLGESVASIGGTVFDRDLHSRS